MPRVRELQRRENRQPALNQSTAACGAEDGRRFSDDERRDRVAPRGPVPIRSLSR